jgi:hypothetical protein
MTQQQHHRTHTFTTQLDREWQRLRHQRRSLSAARSWAALVEPDLARSFATAADLDDLVAATQRGAAEGDRILLALVALSDVDQLAGRIVVQRVLPGLVSAAAKYRFMCGGSDPAEVATGALWIAIRKYDHAVRRRHVAASLISDAIFAAFRRQTRVRSAGEAACEPSHFEQQMAEPRCHPFEELAAVVGEARRCGVPAHDQDLLRHLVQVGSPGVVARERNVTPRTIRNHRDRATARVRAAVAA